MKRKTQDGTPKEDEDQRIVQKDVRVAPRSGRVGDDVERSDSDTDRREAIDIGGERRTRG